MKKLIVLLLIVVLLTACGTFQIGFEPAQGPEPTSAPEVVASSTPKATEDAATKTPAATETAQPTATPTATATAEPEPTDQADEIFPTEIIAVVVVADQANLYAGPSADSEVVGFMFGGLPIPVDGISADGAWFHAHCPDAPDPSECDYWVSSDPNIVQPLDEMPDQGTPIDPPIFPTEVTAVTVVADEINLRAAPSINAAIVGKMFGGLPIPVNGISADGAWFHAHCPDAPDPSECDYWFSSNPNLVQPLDELPDPGSSTGPPILPTEVTAVTVVADEINLRAAPSANAAIVGKMFGGLPIPINGISEDGAWYHAHCPDAPDPSECDYWVSSDPSLVQPITFP